jgi:hypothetical protein
MVGYNQVCCLDPSEDRVVVDFGDQCCNGIPYITGGSQICCNSKFISA